MTKILVVAEHANGKLNPATAKCVTCASQIQGAQIDVAVLAADAGDVAKQAAAIQGVKRVLKIENAANKEPLAAVLAPQVAAAAADYTHVFGPSTTFGKDLMPRVAALLGVGQLSDIMAVESAYKFRRPVYAGNAVITVEAQQDRKLVATVRTASFQPAGSGGSGNVEAANVNAQLPTHTRFVSRSAAATGRPDLQTASRAAVDAGYAANDLQVGQTGKIISPELYVAIGISGAIQHLTGIKDARTIVAINKDSEAPIFEIADIGLVGDLFAVLPELEKALSG
jgi:electron transfer flavoprotein alpha subunit